jgi:hypothetical protein
VNTTSRTALPNALTVLSLALALGLVACGKAAPVESAADGQKKAHEAAVADLKQPIALIAAYAPYARYPDSTDKYAPARHPDLDKSTLCAANEIRYAANKARQKLEVSSSDATKDVQTALGAVTAACADASEPGSITKCADAVTALDASLAKTAAAATALGVAGKYPRVAPESVTDEAKASIASFLKAKGPGASDKAYADKRADPKASAGDVIAACQAAQGDASQGAQVFEKADEPIRLIAATRKMSLDSQCRRLDEVQSLSKDLSDCRKKAKSTECKIVCGKTKNWIDDGLPAATFAPIAKDYADICAKN